MTISTTPTQHHNPNTTELTTLLLLLLPSPPVPKYPYAIKPVFQTPRPIRLTLVIHTGEFYACCVF